MNIFEHRDSFFGKLDGEITGGSLLPLFQLAKQIQSRMGNQGYLLDCYLSLFFEGVSNALAYEAADEGFLSGGEFQTLCLHALDGTEPEKEHPLCQRVKEAYAKLEGELLFQERHTRLCLLFFPLADELISGGGHIGTDFVQPGPCLADFGRSRRELQVDALIIVSAGQVKSNHSCIPPIVISSRSLRLPAITSAIEIKP